MLLFLSRRRLPLQGLVWRQCSFCAVALIKNTLGLTNHGSQRRLSAVGFALRQWPGVAAFNVSRQSI